MFYALFALIYELYLYYNKYFILYSSVLHTVHIIAEHNNEYDFKFS